MPIDEVYPWRPKPGHRQQLTESSVVRMVAEAYPSPAYVVYTATRKIERNHRHRRDDNVHRSHLCHDQSLKYHPAPNEQISIYQSRWTSIL